MFTSHHCSNWATAERLHVFFPVLPTVWMRKVECSLPWIYNGANDITWHCKTNIPDLAFNWRSKKVGSYHFHWPGGSGCVLCVGEGGCGWTPLASMLPDSIPYPLPCRYGVEWLAHYVMPVTRNPFTALNRCPCLPPPPSPLSKTTLPPSCPSPPEDDKSSSAL